MPISVNNPGSGSNSVSQGSSVSVGDTSSVEPNINSTNAPAGLNQNELNDPNSIKVTVVDAKTPIVVLYGPPSCGKTMTLVRLTRYLATQGYTVVPDKTFRPSYDENYRQLCESFDKMINSDSAATSTTNISFMLVRVLKNGKPVCQLLEAPGEYYFTPDDPNRPYPAYVNEILNSRNRKVWAVMIDPDWIDASPKRDYVTRITNLKKMMTSRDKVAFVYNKIDKTEHVRRVGIVDTALAIQHVENNYPGIFKPFENQNPITRFFKKYNCEFIPFSTGSYSRTMDGRLTYTEGHYFYPQKLWRTMLKLING